MTTAIFDSTPRVANGRPASQAPTRAISDDRAAASVVFLLVGAAPWLDVANRQLVDSAGVDSLAEPAALDRARAFLGGLPSWIAQPFVAIGDAGIVDVEWEGASGALTVSFSGDGDSAAWVGADGSEWDADLRQAVNLTAKLADISGV